MMISIPFNMSFDRFMVILAHIMNTRYATNCTIYIPLHFNMPLSFSASRFPSDIKSFSCCFLTSDAFVTLINSSLDSFITKNYIL